MSCVQARQLSRARVRITEAMVANAGDRCFNMQPRTLMLSLSLITRARARAHTHTHTHTHTAYAHTHTHTHTQHTHTHTHTHTLTEPQCSTPSLTQNAQTSTQQSIRQQALTTHAHAHALTHSPTQLIKWSRSSLSIALNSSKPFRRIRLRVRACFFTWVQVQCDGCVRGYWLFEACSYAHVQKQQL